MQMKITYFGHSAFRIETSGAVIMLDPFLTGNRLFNGDVKEVSKGATHVLLTHGHDDHLGDTVDICKATGATLVANFEVAMYLAAKGVANYSPGNPGGRIAFDDFDCVFTNAWHSSSHIDKGIPTYLGNPAGFVILPKKEKGRGLYVSGDTSINYDMKLVHDLYKPAFGIVCIGDRFTMGPDQAAHACKTFFKFKKVIPCHYATFEGFLIPDAKPFVKAMGPKAKTVAVMKSGESMTV
jgi:L-ascorbate metabolism protein UlaG (beta-lactamase superfamily)